MRDRDGERGASAGGEAGDDGSREDVSKQPKSMKVLVPGEVAR